MIIVLASTSSLSALTTALNIGLACISVFAIALWGVLSFWTWRDIRTRTSDRRLQIGATVLVASLFLGGLFIYRLLRPRRTLVEIAEQQLEEASLLAEMTEREICPNCQARVESDFQVCPACSQKLKHPCPTCARMLDLRWALCPYCGTHLASRSLPGTIPGIQGRPLAPFH